MEQGTRDDVSFSLALASFTSSVGLALGELLLLSGRSRELFEHVREIHISAQATLIASDLRGGVARPSGRSLASAAFRVVRVWRETEDLAELGGAIQVLEEVLEVMGVRYVALSERRSLSESPDPAAVIHTA